MFASEWAGYVRCMVSLRASAAFDRIFVGGVPRGTTEPQLRAAFAVAGIDVGLVEFVVDRVTGLQRGFAFVDLCLPISTSTDTPAFGQVCSATLAGHALDIQAVPARRAPWRAGSS